MSCSGNSTLSLESENVFNGWMRCAQLHRHW